MFELFNLDSPAHTPRVPLRWLEVSLHHKKPDRPGTLYFGVVRDPRAVLYNTDRSVV
ncbi:hypothetical protein [Streptomyces sp. NPDC058240]|uniref:hypothetical protein n=1 Tax=Streptomyces sp. NPDC058240 TaxID=3346396 RepID=UPI0036E4BA1E